MSEYSNSERLAKNCDFIVRPFKRESVQIPPHHIVEMLFEYFGGKFDKTYRESHWRRNHSFGTPNSTTLDISGKA